MGQITLNKPSGGQLTLSPEDGTSNETVTIPSVGVGKVLQVVQTHNGNRASWTTTGWTTVPNLSASITPSSADSKILVCVSVSLLSAFTGHAHARLQRDGSPIATGEASTYAQGTMGGYYNPNGDAITNLSYTYLDSPATTSTVTYTVGAYQNSGTTYMNGATSVNDSASSSIVLMEVAA